MTGSIIIEEDRIISLAGSQNFREVGGYPTRDGRRMKRGKIWRSARLDGLTSEDINVAALRSIRTIADLRRESERTSNPTPPAFTGMRTLLAWDRDHIDLARPERLFASGLDAAGYAEAIRQFYRNLADGHSEQLASLYRHVAEGALPLLIHCSAGKDRTGIAVAILLELIGVDRDYIIADYCKTSELLDWGWLTSGAAAAGMRSEWLDQLEPEALEALMRADASYLESAFDELERRYGSIAGFARDGLDLSEGEIERLEYHLVER